ncbi:hypothetical protein [Pseudogracilibacillus sp. SO10305]|uniref:hypothetical protein n=1 Tax=Pseudogracilibacillus sp. SO10305 TaxID=3098292 RepID=UPI00300E4C47
MVELYLFFMTVFVSLLLILFILIALIRHIKFKSPFFLSQDQKFIPYDYYKVNGERSIVLTIIFGSFGILYADISFGFLFFFINSIMYFFVFANTIFESNTPLLIVALIPFTRVLNIIAIILFAKIRLKTAENKFNAYVENDLYQKLILVHFEYEKKII